MQTTYDQQADALYIQLTLNAVVSTKRVNDQVAIDFDETGNIIGVEVLYVRATGIDPVVFTSDDSIERPDTQMMEAGHKARMLALKRQREQSGEPQS